LFSKDSHELYKIMYSGLTNHCICKFSVDGYFLVLASFGLDLRVICE